jgi:ABC-2 type transport system ATP-binding protein
VPDAAAAAAALAAADLTCVADPNGGLLVETDDPAAVTRTLAGAGIWLTELTPLRPDLETFFLQLTAADNLGTSTEGVSR